MSALSIAICEIHLAQAFAKAPTDLETVVAALEERGFADVTWRDLLVAMDDALPKMKKLLADLQAEAVR